MGFLTQVIERFKLGSAEEPETEQPSTEATTAGIAYTKSDHFVRLLEAQDGRMRQSDLVSSTDWSESTVSRVLSQMEADQTIRKIRVGRENVVTLTGSEPDWYTPPEPADWANQAEDAEDYQDVPPVLVVEDNPRDTELLKQGFAECGVKAQLHTVRDGVDAMEFLTNQGAYRDTPRPCIVLLDLSLLLVDGFELLNEVNGRDDLRGIPFIVLSNSRNPSDIESAYENGATAYLTKPTDFDGMVELCRTIGEFWLDHTLRPQ